MSNVWMKFRYKSKKNGFKYKLPNVRYPGLKCLITIFFGSLILNTADTFCTAPLNTFVTLQLTLSYTFLFMWGWIIIGPIPCKSTKPIMIMYGIYVFTQFIVGILGTVWYNMGRLECSESVPELTKMSLFEVVTFWLTCEWRFLVFCFLK